MVEDITYRFSQADMTENKIMGMLCYLGAFILVPLFMAKDSPFVKHNLNQGIILCIMWAGMNLVGWLLTLIPFGGIFLTILNFVSWSVAFTAIYHIFMGKAIKFKYIGDYDFIK